MDFRCEGELIAYRLGHADYPIVDGGGAFKYGSRWCSPGRYIIHAASAYALAVLENLVHWRVAALPPSMQFVRMTIPAATSRNATSPETVMTSMSPPSLRPASVTSPLLDRALTAPFISSPLMLPLTVRLVQTM